MTKTFEQGKDKVDKLCQYFATNRRSLLAPGVKEAHIRHLLIDPFFESLGWDVRNEARAAPQYREVILEDSLDVEGQQKAPDYSFRVGTLPKFFVEAKKCGVNIHADPVPAYQLRRYGWSAKIAVSILTDFEELSVYDCTSRPRESDKASRSRILYFRCDEYVARWDELWNLFSREAVWSGRFDEYAASKRKRGTSEVDVEFLKEIEGWREALARNLALRNKDLSAEDLSAAVQRTIDRIVFLRIAEDRGLEPDEQLLRLCERSDIYSRFMRELCRKADEKYNSGLFHFQKEPGVSDAPDRITPSLTIDDKIFKPIIEGLYFAHGSPYDFRVMPVDILGTVYERFLGKVIRLTAGHQAKIEEKPEVKKAGGVYYTPAYIVDYIIRQTVGQQIEGKSPAQLAGSKGRPPLRVLDMACGSGSFLLGAYQYLLDHYLKWYIDHKPQTHQKAVYNGTRTGQWRLSIGEKKRILTTHIFGVDIDPQAVEVSKLSLLLQALEGENDATLTRQLRLFELQRALPNLANNIQCGNSLIGTDYFSGQPLADLEDEEVNRVKAFDWREHFPEAMAADGFDCVVGNPPYVLLQNTQNDESQLSYLQSHYRVCAYKIDTYHLFLERGIGLIRPGGNLGFIVPNTFLRNQHALELRSMLLENSQIQAIRLFDYPVFAGASVDTAIIIAAKQHSISSTFRARLFRSRNPTDTFELPSVRQASWFAHPRKEFTLGEERASESLRKKLEEASFPLGEIATAYFGIQTHDRGTYVSPKQLSGVYRAVVDGANISRYGLSASSEFVCFRPKAIKSGGNEAVYSQPRIGVRQIGAVPVATWLPAGLCTLNTIYNIFFTKPTAMDLRFVLAVVNAAATRWYWRQLFYDQKRTFPKIKKPDLLAIRIPSLDLATAADKRRHDKVLTLVDSLLRLVNRDLSTKSDALKKAVRSQIESTETELDRCLFDCYGLSENEISIIKNDDTKLRPK